MGFYRKLMAKIASIITYVYHQHRKETNMVHMKKVLFVKVIREKTREERIGIDLELEARLMARRRRHRGWLFRPRP